MTKSTGTPVKAKSGLAMLAKKTATTAAKKADTKVSYKCEDDETSAAIESYLENKRIVDEATAKMKLAESTVKGKGKEFFIKEVEKTKRAPESFILASKSNKSLLYIVQDGYKYADLDDARVEYLRNTYGEEIVTTKEEYVINPELVSEYGDILAELIMGSKKIPNEVKADLIALKQKHTITKGTINRMHEVAVCATKNLGQPVTIEAVFDEIKPTQQLKARGKGE